MGRDDGVSATEPFRCRCNRCGRCQDFDPEGKDPRDWRVECEECHNVFRPWKPRGKAWLWWNRSSLRGGRRS